MDPETRTHRVLADDSRVRILSILREAGRPMDTRELGKAVGLHATTVRAHLELLFDAGFVTSAPEARSTPGRPRMLYQATEVPGQPPESGGYRLLAEILASHLAGTSEDAAARAVEAGEAWGGYLVERPAPYLSTPAPRALDEVIALFDRLGFDPESEDGRSVRLRRCPFLDVARNHQQVVCSVHLGLLRGALAALRTPLLADRIEPFAEPGLCLAHLSEEWSEAPVTA
jgi:predicted ArsR family transcriptional regulator